MCRVFGFARSLRVSSSPSISGIIEIADDEARQLARRQLEPLPPVSGRKNAKVVVQCEVDDPDDFRSVLHHQHGVSAVVLVDVAVDHPLLGRLVDLEESEIFALGEL